MFGTFMEEMINPPEIGIYAMLSTGFASDFLVSGILIAFIAVTLIIALYTVVVRKGPGVIGKRASQVLAVLIIVVTFPASLLMIALTPDGFFWKASEKKPRYRNAGSVLVALMIGIFILSHVAMVSVVGTMSLNNGKRMIASMDRSITDDDGVVRAGIFPSAEEVAAGPASLSWIEKDEGRNQKKMAYLVSSERLWSRFMDISPVDLDRDAYDWFVDLRKNVAIADFGGNKVACVYSGGTLSAVLPSKLMFAVNALRYEGTAYMKEACPAEVDDEAERVPVPTVEDVFRNGKAA